MNSRRKHDQTQKTLASQQVVEIPFDLRSDVASVASVQPISGGLCLPKGQISNIASAQIRTGRESSVAQVEVLSRWSDGSVRWLLASWIAVPAEQSVACSLQLRSLAHNSDHNLDDAARMTLRRSGQQIALQRTDPFATPPEFANIHLAPRLTLVNGSVAEIDFDEIVAESQGLIRSVYCIAGELRTDHHISLQLRFEVWPTIGLVQVHTRLLNSRRARHHGGLWDLGDAGSFDFAALQLDAKLQTREAPTVRWKLEQSGNVRSQIGSADLRIVQRGSGGRAWANTNHVASDGRSTVTSRGYEAVTASGTIHGYRSDPVVNLESDDCQLTMVMPEFWQKFPSALSVQPDGLTAELFPVSERCRYELQGGEQSTQLFWLSIAAMNEDLTSLDWVHSRSRMVQSPEWVQQTGVFDWCPGPVNPAASAEPANAARRYSNWLQEVTSGSRSLIVRRESIDEYGWRNFGDIPADHEQTHYAGSNTIVSHYNNQFDSIYGGILNLIVSGDSVWHDLFDPLARHVMDIDIYHTDEDRLEFNGGLFWHTDHYADAHTATHRTYSGRNTPPGGDYGGGPSNEHNYSTGLLYYYYLTGSPEAAASVRSLADWVCGMDDGTATVFGLLDGGPTGGATATVTADYHGPGRGSGNSISVLLDGWEVTKEERYLSKAEELIRRVVHPDQNLDELNLLDAEYRWSYSVCLTSLGR